MAKYTFLIPAYKAEFLNEALSSIQNQTYKDFAVIISNDKSPQNLQSIVDPFLSDSRFTYRENSSNMGKHNLVSHWNLLVNLCNTEYLIMGSDDDTYDIHFLEEIDKLTLKYSQVDLFHARANCINEKGIIFKKDALYYEYVSQLDYLEQLDYYLHIECMANYVFKTSALKKSGGFVNFPLAWSSDTATTNLLSANGVANTKDILFSFRMSGLNISSIEKGDKEIAKQKFYAYCMYDEYMINLFKSMTIEDTLLAKETYSRVLKQHKHRISDLIAYYSSELSIKEFIKYYSTYKRKGYINSSFIIIKKWIFSKFFS